MTWTVKNIASGGYLVTTEDGRFFTVPNEPLNRHYQAVQDWIAAGNTPLPADPPPAPPTLDEIYDATLQQQRVFKAYVLAVNDGSVVPGMTLVDLKTAVKAKM